MLTPEQLSALQTIASAAVAAERATGCPAELSTAQCIVESSWLTVCPGNNCFGIKATDSICTYCLTKEYLNGKWESPTLAFEAYPALSDCFAAHARLLQGGVYAAAWAAYQSTPLDLESERRAVDLDAYITGISKHYATDPTYASKIITLAHGPHVTAAIQAARGQA